MDKICDDIWLDEMYQNLLNKMDTQCRRTGTNIPFIPRNGRYVDCIMPGGLLWWTNGFWPGMLWQMFYATKEDVYKEKALGVGERLAETLNQPNKLDHDVGFLFLPTAVTNYRITNDEAVLNIGLHAANLLAGRFNHKGGFIRAWNKHPDSNDVSGWMIVDCLMNLPLLFWASEQSGDPRFANIAKEHAKTSLDRLLRNDGSCNHIAVFDPLTGEFLENLVGQGYGKGSSWSRGQGWAVYGFALAYRYTGQTEFLEGAKKCAHYCIANLSVSDWLPLLDFRAPAEPVRYDSGAGAIIACGLLEVAELVPEMEKPLYYNAAIQLVKACNDKFSNWNPDEDGILEGGSTRYHNDPLAGHAYIYNDYFFLESILRLKKAAMRIW